MSQRDQKEEKKETNSASAENEAPEPKPDNKKVKELKKQIDELEKKNKQLQDERDELMEKAKDWENRYYTAYADMANTRKAVEKETQDYKRYALSSCIQELIPIMDSFDMALKNEPADESLKNYLSGFKMIHSKLLSAFKQLGVEIIEPKVGDPYDPHSMEAYTTTEGEEDNLVAETFTRGYKLHDHLLRAAGVIITRKPAPPEEKKDDSEASKPSDSSSGVGQSTEAKEDSQSTEANETKEEK